MSKPTLIAIVAGVVSGVVFVAPLFGSLLGLLLANFTQLPLFLVGLNLGLSAVSIAAVAGAATVVALGGLVPVATFVVTFAVPAVIVVRQTLLSRTAADGSVEWYPSGGVLAILVCYGLAALAVVMSLVGSPEGGMLDMTRAWIDQGLAQIAPDLPADTRADVAADMSTLFPALLVTSWLLTILANVALAHASLARWGSNRRPSLDLLGVELPLAMAFAFAAGVALWLIGGDILGLIGKTLTVAIAAVYVFQGIALVHHVSRGWPGRTFALTVFYFILLVLLGLPGLALVAALGLADQLIGLRRRFAGAAPGKEDD